MAKFRAIVVLPEKGEEMVLFDRSDLMNALALGVGMLIPGATISLEKMTKEGAYGPYRSGEGVLRVRETDSD